MEEILPLASGFVIGSLLTLVRRRVRLPLGAVLVGLFAAIATVASGEVRVSAWFVVIDLALVGAAAAAGFLAVGRLRNPRHLTDPR